MISLTEAHACILALKPLPPAFVLLDKALGLVCAEDVYAAANCPSVDSSLKDGFAVISADIADASSYAPVSLTVIGILTAGDGAAALVVGRGEAVRIMTGAPLPEGATAVLASEFAETDGDLVRVKADSPVGKNILRKGSDIVKGQLVLANGTVLSPAHLGLLAAAGLKGVVCYPLPKIAIVATGSELVWPGEPVSDGKVAASNMVVAAAELQSLGIIAVTAILRDHLDGIRTYLQDLVERVDILITCGGVLDGDKDLTMRAMEEIGMMKIFHRVRIGPGKGACMGRVGATLIFNLPGGPPSNHVALILLALPGVRRTMGLVDCLPFKRQVFVMEELAGQEDWTQLVYGKVGADKGSLYASSLCHLGRLEAMAAANILIEIPEGCTAIGKGDPAEGWFFNGRNPF